MKNIDITMQNTEQIKEEIVYQNTTQNQTNKILEDLNEKK